MLVTQFILQYVKLPVRQLIHIVNCVNKRVLALGVRVRLRVCASDLRVFADADGMCSCESVRKEREGRARQKGVRGEPSPRLSLISIILNSLNGSAVKFSHSFKCTPAKGWNANVSLHL